MQTSFYSHFATVAPLRGTVFISCALAAMLSACSGNDASGVPASSAKVAVARRSPHGIESGLFKNPALVAFDNATGTLEYWTIKAGGSHKPATITSSLRINSAAGMAADGTFLTIAGSSPGVMLTYDLRSQVQMSYLDPSGPPLDITLAKGDTAYVINNENVVGYPLDRSAGRPFSCPSISEAVSVAVDDQSDVFVDGYGPSFAGVVEFPTSSWTCMPLDLKPEQGILGGIGVDPATDDLIVIDNPNSCNGSGDGRMTIYAPPYSPKTATQVDLNASYCAGKFRLDAASQNMFLMDSDDGGAQIDEFTYPGGRSEGVYSGGTPGAFITLPNSLPN